MPDFPPVIPAIVSVEEQYELVERKALSVDTGGQSYAITTSEPKVATLTASGCDMQVDTQPITTGVSMSITLKGQATTIYAKATAGSGTLYIMVFK